MNNNSNERALNLLIIILVSIWIVMFVMIFFIVPIKDAILINNECKLQTLHGECLDGVPSGALPLK